MRFRRLILVQSVVLTLMLVAGPGWERIARAAGADVGGNRLKTFEMPDQHEARHVVAFPRERLLLLTVADRDGSEQVHDWVRPIHREYGSRLEILGVAHLGPMPRLFRGRIQRELRRAYEHPLLLDWTGDVTGSLGARPELANIFLVDTDGGVLHHGCGPATDSTLARLREAIEKALERAGTGS
jgi:hypothetical protein